MIPSWIGYISTMHFAGFAASFFLLTSRKLKNLKDDDVVSSKDITNILIYSQIWETAVLAQAFGLIADESNKDKKE